MISGSTRKLKYKEGHPKVIKGHSARYDFRVDTETERTQIQRGSIPSSGMISGLTRKLKQEWSFIRPGMISGLTRQLKNSCQVQVFDLRIDKEAETLRVMV